MKIISCFFILFSTGLFAQNGIENYQVDVNKYLLKMDSIKKSSIGKEFYDFKAKTLEGNSAFKRDLLGKITIVDIWFENCAPCLVELEKLSELYKKFKDISDFKFLSFTIDSPDVAIKAVKKYNISYEVCPISREVANNMNFNMGFPTKIIINREGKIVFFKIGGSTNSGIVEKDIKEIEDIIRKLIYQ